jgi:O-antigen/teichoic acid export membrane protein
MTLPSPSRFGALDLRAWLWANPTMISWANQGITIAGFMMIVVVALRSFTTQQFGLWMSLNILIGIGQLADLGFRLAASRGLAWYYSGAVELPDYAEDGFRRTAVAGGQPNILAMARLIRTLQCVYLGLAAVSVPLTCIAGYWLCQNLIGLSGGASGDWVAVGFTIGVVALNITGGLYSGLLQGLNEIALLNGIQLVCGILRVVASCILLAAEFKVLALMLAALAVMLVQVVWTRWAFFRPQNPWITILPQTIRFDRLIFFKIWPSTWRTGVIVIGGYFITQGASMVATQLSDPALIASYLLTAKVYSVLGSMATVPLNVLLPQITYLRAKKMTKAIQQLIASRILPVLIVLTFMAAMASIVGNPVLGYFGSPVRLIEGPTAWLLTIWVVLEAHHVFHSNVYSTTNHLPFVVLSLTSGLLIVSLGVLVAPWGVMWLAIVQTGVQIIGNNWYPVYLNLKSLDWHIDDYLSKICIEPMRRKSSAL